MIKIKCPHCFRVVMEIVNGNGIRIKIPRKDGNDYLYLPFTQGPFIHGLCGRTFNLDLTKEINSVILILESNPVKSEP